MNKYNEKEVKALAIIACKHKEWREFNAKILKAAGQIIDKLIIPDGEASVQKDLSSFTEYYRAGDRGLKGAREKIRQVLEEAGIEITKTNRGKYVARRRKGENNKPDITV